jgi:hypothetical protein
MNSCILPGTFRMPSKATLVDLAVRVLGAPPTLAEAPS